MLLSISFRKGRKVDRKEKAIALHDRKFNCAQSVVLAFDDVWTADPVTVFKAAESFGFGMGDASQTCGAISGMGLVLGLTSSDGNLSDPGTKKTTYGKMSVAVSKFRERTGACTCRELKGLSTGKTLCSCFDCIRIAVEILEEML